MLATGIWCGGGLLDRHDLSDCHGGACVHALYELQDEARAMLLEESSFCSMNLRRDLPT